MHCKQLKRIPAPSTTSTDPNPTGQETSQPPPATTVQTTKSQHPRKPRKKALTRPLPLFARIDAGHVFFSGNERLQVDQNRGVGTAFT